MECHAGTNRSGIGSDHSPELRIGRLPATPFPAAVFSAAAPMLRARTMTQHMSICSIRLLFVLSSESKAGFECFEGLRNPPTFLMGDMRTGFRPWVTVHSHAV